MMSPRILILDDEPTIVTLLKDALTLEGYEVEGVTRADEALRIAGESRPDLVITDLTMPGMDGVEFYKRIVGIAPYLMGRIVVITGGVGHEKVSSFLKETGCPYLFKPFSLKELERVVRKTLRREGDGKPDR